MTDEKSIGTEVESTEVKSTDVESAEIESTDNWLMDEESIFDGGAPGDETDMWDGIGEALDRGYDFFEHNKMEKCLELWEPVWERLKKNVAKAFRKMEIFEVDDATDYEYGIDEWLSDMITAYYVRRDFQKCLQFCEDVKEVFAWEEQSPNEFNEMIGSSLLGMGKVEESDAWFEEWLQREPDNFDCVIACITYWQQRDQKEKAKALLDSTMESLTCNIENNIMFLRAASLYKMFGDEEKSDYYKSVYDKFIDDMEKNLPHYGGSWEDKLYFNDQGFDYERQEPIVKPPKIYPNDPCPCGSGKKYKKCCGKG